MQFINKQDDLPFGLLHFRKHGLQALFKLTAIFGSGNERAHIQRDELLVFQPFRHIALDDAVGQPFHDGGLAHSRFAYEHGIVLGAA